MLKVRTLVITGITLSIGATLLLSFLGNHVKPLQKIGVPTNFSNTPFIMSDYRLDKIADRLGRGEYTGSSWLDMEALDAIEVYVLSQDELGKNQIKVFTPVTGQKKILDLVNTANDGKFHAPTQNGLSDLLIHYSDGLLIRGSDGKLYSLISYGMQGDSWSINTFINELRNLLSSTKFQRVL